MKTNALPTPGSAEPRERLRLNAFLDLAALFMVALAVVVRPLFPGLAVDADQNILVTALVLVAAAMVALRGILLSKWPTSLGWTLVPLAAYVILVGALAGFVAPYRHAAILRTIDVAGLLLLLFAAGAVVTDARRARLVLAAIVATALCVALYGIYQLFVEFPAWVTDINTHARHMMDIGRLSPGMETAFRNRLLSLEVFSTFLLSNSFGGYLLLVMPIGVAWLTAAARRKRIGQVIVCAAFLAVGLAALYLTQSKGAWLTVPAVCVVVLFVFWQAWRPKTLRWALLGILIAGLLGSALLWTLGALPAKATEGIRASADVRLGYWEGARKLIYAHPLLGIGPGNFHDAYIQVKSPEATEVRRAHNGYLEIWCETGTFGLVLWVAFWAMVLSRLWRRSAATSAWPSVGSADRFTRLVIGAGGVLAIVFQLVLVGTPKLPSLLAGAMIGLWALAYAALTRPTTNATDEPDQDTQDTLPAWGIWCGLVALLVHSLIDFDMSVPGIIWTAMVMTACLSKLGTATCFSAKEDTKKTGPVPIYIAAKKTVAVPVFLLVAMVVVFVAWMTVVMPIGRGAAHLARAERFRSRRNVMHREAQLVKAMSASPGNAEIPLKLGLLYAERYTRQPEIDHFDMAVNYYRQVERLRPLDERPSLYMARLCRFAGRDDEALAAIDRALGAYPTMPAMHKLRGTILEQLNRKAEAVASYEKALELSEKSRQRERKFSKAERDELLQRIEGLRTQKPES